jgi:hypothetical protein
MMMHDACKVHTNKAVTSLDTLLSGVMTVLMNTYIDNTMLPKGASFQNDLLYLMHCTVCCFVVQSSAV